MVAHKIWSAIIIIAVIWGGYYFINKAQSRSYHYDIFHGYGAKRHCHHHRHRHRSGLGQ